MIEYIWYTVHVSANWANFIHTTVCKMIAWPHMEHNFRAGGGGMPCQAGWKGFRRTTKGQKIKTALRAAMPQHPGGVARACVCAVARAHVQLHVFLLLCLRVCVCVCLCVPVCVINGVPAEHLQGFSS